MSSSDWKALAAAVKARRAERRRPQDLRQFGGPGPMTVRKIEYGAADVIRPKTKGQLEVALDWPDGYVDAILDGTSHGPHTPIVTREPARPDDPGPNIVLHRGQESYIFPLSALRVGESEIELTGIASGRFDRSDDDPTDEETITIEFVLPDAGPDRLVARGEIWVQNGFLMGGGVYRVIETVPTDKLALALVTRLVNAAAGGGLTDAERAWLGATQRVAAEADKQSKDASS